MRKYVNIRKSKTMNTVKEGISDSINDLRRQSCITKFSGIYHNRGINFFLKGLLLQRKEYELYPPSHIMHHSRTCT